MNDLEYMFSLISILFLILHMEIINAGTFMSLPTCTLSGKHIVAAQINLK